MTRPDKSYEAAAVRTIDAADLVASLGPAMALYGGLIETAGDGGRRPCGMSHPVFGSHPGCG